MHIDMIHTTDKVAGDSLRGHDWMAATGGSEFRSSPA